MGCTTTSDSRIVEVNPRIEEVRTINDVRETMDRVLNWRIPGVFLMRGYMKLRRVSVELGGVARIIEIDASYV